MAVANVIAQATGSPTRSAMCAVDMDNVVSFLSGTVIGATIGTADTDGVAVHVPNVQAFTSTGVLTGWELMVAWAEKINAPSGGVAGARAWAAENLPDKEYVLHVESQHSEGFNPATSVSIATPTFVPGT